MSKIYLQGMGQIMGMGTRTAARILAATGLGIMSFMATANVAPVANAGPDRTVKGGNLIRLTGLNSSDVDGSIATYRWTQLQGPAVSFSDSASSTPQFTAPVVSAPTVLQFRLVVTDNAGATDDDTVSITAKPQLQVTSLQLAQTHLLFVAGKNWQLTDSTGAVTAEESLHPSGRRPTLVLAQISSPTPVAPRVVAWLDGVQLGTVSLLAPNQLPPTESGGPAYAGDRYSAVLPAEWMKPGLRLAVTASNYVASMQRDIEVGADFDMKLRVLPFYLFGATPINSEPLSQTGVPPDDAKLEIAAKWPAATVDATNHPAHKVSWPYLVVGPRSDSSGVARAAYVANSTDDYKDGYAGMSAVLGVLGGLLSANGESPQAVQYYAPLLALNAAGESRGTGGGLGGGSVGTGDSSYAGIFIHEQGHAFGLPHVGGAYDSHKYPYNWGSLKGSAWGYDINHGEFLAPFVPSSASRYGACASDTFDGHARALDAANRCVKQDPMQSGSGDQASGYRYASFSDYSTAVMQRWFEGKTTVNGDGTHSYSGGKVARDASFPGGYKRWDRVDRRWVNYDTATSSGGLYGLHQNLPLQYDVPVYSIVVTLSYAGTAGATQIYPPLRYTGNLLELIDPTVATERSSITPNTGTHYWYCHNGGCDYTLRVTYAGGTVRHLVLQGGFRPWFGASSAPSASASDPLLGDSFRRWVVNVPDDGDITRIELLDTPMVWNGMPANPTVLASR